MVGTIDSLLGTRLLLCAADGPPLAGERDATDVLGDAFSGGANLVVVPVSRLADEFFQLRTGVAGAITQKFAQYRTRLAVVGDITARVAASPTLRDFVAEANRGNQLWFVSDLPALEERLARQS